ncbi:ribose 5-phosphate isomerase B [Thermoflexus sp.]|uniref:ribose 5-phosphate isomerase B n=2 Tax=Thermoflexus sp. TaxID=1969742 RepID=UPI0025E02328|nr:ribose 5-phosphate isomerase B [Thermoflexus sp.]MDW8179885.1 ribose 5-phosphate isomerase B [Anaerolineae bacterium]MCS6963295.1 ribose 5-phosphate isomerase B [Thermoflexus sp.]MCS7350434.1 ribose 5-phosphate isomerase B [Thermoflexus sp.]MCX7689374.1 ribose 5-phosphate isomerase B [Thermoflexus sp.]MDW8183952.1 ribose 5-phosphate isomerase B [Anaerolineae bacterium]
MRIAIGADHAGYTLKETLVAYMREHGIEVIDFGTHGPDSVDYPDYARVVAEAVAGGGADFGVLICGTGIGMSIAANKVPGIRAAAVSDVYSARMSRAHNDANILCLGGRVVGPGLAIEILETWLRTSFEGGRHARRLEKIRQLEIACEASS